VDAVIIDPGFISKVRIEQLEISRDFCQRSQCRLILCGKTTQH